MKTAIAYLRVWADNADNNGYPARADSLREAADRLENIAPAHEGWSPPATAQIAKEPPERIWLFTPTPEGGVE
jgi:hypothetical protein